MGGTKMRQVCLLRSTEALMTSSALSRHPSTTHYRYQKYPSIAPPSSERPHCLSWYLDKAGALIETYLDLTTVS
jgi:hypothetical protein